MKVFISADIEGVTGVTVAEDEVADGFAWCWQWRLRDNPYFAPLKENPRFKAALAGVAGNVARQKAKYAELKVDGDHSG